MKPLLTLSRPPLGPGQIFPYYCRRCTHVQDRAPRGTCEQCGSEDLEALSWRSKPDYQKALWLCLIRRGTVPKTAAVKAYSALTQGGALKPGNDTCSLTDTRQTL